MFTRLRDLIQARERSDDPRQDLINLSLAYRRWAIERPERYAIAMHRFVGQRRRPRSPEGIAVSQAALQELRDVVQRCHDAGLLVDGREPEEVVTLLRANVHGLAEFENLGMLAPDPRPTGSPRSRRRSTRTYGSTPPRPERGAARRAQRYGA